MKKNRSKFIHKIRQFFRPSTFPAPIGIIKVFYQRALRRPKLTFGIGSGMISVAVDALAGVITIPMVLKHLSGPEAGFWVLMTVVGGILFLIFNSYTPAVSRIVACSAGEKDGFLDFKLIQSIQKAFGILLFTGCIVAFGIAVFYLRPISSSGLGNASPLLSWGVYAIGLCLYFSGLSLLSILNGLGELGWDKALRIVTSLLGLSANFLLLLSYPSILGLSFIFLTQNIIFLMLSWLLYRKLAGKRIIAGTQAVQLQNAHTLLMESGGFLVLTFSGYLANFSGIFIVEYVCGLATTAKYNAIARVGLILCATSAVISQMTYPLFARAFVERNWSECNKLRKLNIVAALGLYLICACVLYSVSPWLMPWWLGRGNYLGGDIFGALLFFGLVNVFNTAIATPAIAAVGGKKFIPQAMANALCVPVFSYFLAQKFGVVGVVWGMTAGMLIPTIWVFWYTQSFFKSAASCHHAPIALNPEPCPRPEE